MEKYLHKCLDSLVFENEDLLKSVEVLVINDGSKDSSSAIAHEYENRYPNTFRVIDKENGNYGSCINRGLLEAKGKYVKVLDADDSFETDKFSQYVSALEGLDVDLIVTDFRLVYEDGNVCQEFHFSYPHKQVLDFIDYNKREDSFRLLMHGVTYRRQIFVDLNYRQTEGVSYTDQQWIFLPFEKVDKFYYLPVMLYNYLTGREGQTMASDVFIKSMPQLMKVNIDRVKMYENYHLYDSRYEWLFTEKLCRAMQSMYRTVLIMDDSQIEKLIAFDKEVESVSPRFFKKMEDIHLIGKLPIRFIAGWRLRKRTVLSPLKKACYKKTESLYLWLKNRV